MCIMVVDDEPDLMSMVKLYLQRWNYEIDGFEDPVLALDAFRAEPSRYSLVLTDIRMPNISGLELAAKLLSIKPDIKIILMTAFELADEVLTRMPSTMARSDILQKPFRLAEVCESLKKQLQIAY